MTTPTISEYLKYANLQMAAEAFIRDPATNVLNGSGDDLIRALMAGNNHALRFTETEATAFADQWTVVDQEADTPCGFSGTLFRSNSNPDEYIISFRSTEFINDAIRDSMATNTLEIFDTGFAWGQLADMEPSNTSALIQLMAMQPRTAGPSRRRRGTNR